MLECLSRERLIEIGQQFELGVTTGMRKQQLVEAVAPSRKASLELVLDALSRDELKTICKEHELDEGGRRKAIIVERILGRSPDDASNGKTEGPSEERAQQPLPLTPELNLAAILDALDDEGLSELAEHFGFSPDRTTQDRTSLIASMVATDLGPLEEVLDELPMDALRGIANQFGLVNGVKRRRSELTKVIVELAGRSEHRGSSADNTQAAKAPGANPHPAHAAPAVALETPGRSATEDGAGRRPSVRGLLRLVIKLRLVELGRIWQVAVNPHAIKEDQIDGLIRAGRIDFADLLGDLKRDELRAACQAYGLPSDGRARQPLMDRLLEARKKLPSTDDREENLEAPSELGAVPAPGDIVRARMRTYLVERIIWGRGDGEATRVQMVCLDDDDPGRPLEVLWELELGARVVHPEAGTLSEFRKLDLPRHFAAYVHALKWNSVTATDAQLFQAPFRAGIKIEPYQLTPLMKALESPRANLLCADDVGLGKTIEAGLVMQELLLRQQVDFVLVVSPASVCLQWRDEMRKRFGLHFEVYDRAFVAARRRERGFAVNPWGTHNRFIISYPLLRRPEHLEPLVAHLGDRKRKSLLVLDEAHTVAPATASRYAIDSGITKIVRDQVAGRFEHRLFLTATPHNGHSNSFSALLEILDPQRFTRGVKVRDPKQLHPVMVRRLKGDIRKICDAPFPERRIVQVDVWNKDGQWWAADSGGSHSKARIIGTGSAIELQLSDLLREYTEILQPRTKRAKLALVGLQKRLQSSVPAFARTLAKHAETFERSYAAALRSEGEQGPRPETEAFADTDDEVDPSDEALAEAEDAEVLLGSRELGTLEGRARELLVKMVDLARQGRSLPDGKVWALVDWMRTHQCAAIGFDEERDGDRSWTDCRVLIFTESVDTKRYLRQMLSAAIRDTEDADERILEIHGAMGDDRREEVQRAFNDPHHPVRILLATDAAREGINLQGQCADLVHFDTPWNPARLEQRNGRIDRTLQPADVVRCHYFCYRDRPEDIVLRAIVSKVETIAKELGSMGEVVHQALVRTLEDGGITAATMDAVDKATASYLQGGAKSDVLHEELESTRTKAFDSLKREVLEANRRLVRSRRQLDYDPELLRDTLNVGLQLMGHDGLDPIKVEANGASATPAYRLPDLPQSWDETLDSLRPARARDEAPWEWRKRPPQPVVFEAPKSLATSQVHLHLQHPFVQRIMDRFLAQGTGAQDLQRVTVVRDPDADQVWVLALGRLSLFGTGAVRLHDRLIQVATPWDERRGPQPGASDPKNDIRVVDRLERLLGDPSALRPVAKRVAREIVATANRDFAALWPHVKDEAESAAHEAIGRLDQRGAEESSALTRILEDQRRAIQKTLAEDHPAQLELLGGSLSKAERAQLDDDRRFMESRLTEIDVELEAEPKALQELYAVKLRRLEPVGLIYLYPESLA